MSICSVAKQENEVMDFDFRKQLGKVTPKIAEGAKVYIFGAGNNWNFICKQYRHLVGVNINEHIDGFIDNDVSKHGTMYHGRQVYALGEIDKENTVILISVLSVKACNRISSQLVDYGMYERHSFFLNYIFFALLMQWEYVRMMQFKDKHKGGRCFIIGNGPSLTSDDLDKLIDEITFAVNGAYLMFDKTKWRPSYYVVSDDQRIEENHKQIAEIDCQRFFAFNTVFEIDEFSLTGDYFYYWDGGYNVWKPQQFWKTGFSEEPSVLCHGATVTYDCIQLAAYMGFKEIYLLGVDNNYNASINGSGELIRSDIDDHFTGQYGRAIYISRTDEVNTAYQTAREYAEQHNIIILNATRGGKLEVFERVDFDELFR